MMHDGEELQLSELAAKAERSGARAGGLVVGLGMGMSLEIRRGGSAVMGVPVPAFFAGTGSSRTDEWQRMESTLEWRIQGRRLVLCDPEGKGDAITCEPSRDNAELYVNFGGKDKQIFVRDTGQAATATRR